MSATSPERGPDQEVSASTTSGELACCQQSQLQSDWSDWSLATTLMHLVLGLALEGGDQLAEHLRRWESAAHTPAAAPERPASVRNLQRYATLGMLIETGYRAGAILRSLSHASNEVATRVGGGFDYGLQRWPLRALRTRLMSLRRDFEEAMEEWVDRGRREEEQARRTARHAAAGLVNEVFDYIAQSPDVRELIERQGASMAETAVEDVRERTTSAHALVGRFVHNLIRRPAAAKRAGDHDASTAGRSEHRGARR